MWQATIDQAYDDDSSVVQQTHRRLSDVSDASSCTLPLNSPENDARSSDRLDDPPLLEITTGASDSLEGPSSLEPSTDATSIFTESTLGNLVGLVHWPHPQGNPSAWPLPQTTTTVDLGVTGRAVPDAMAGMSGSGRRVVKPYCISCQSMMMKCDREGPPCGNCKRYQKTCVWLDRSKWPFRRDGSPDQLPDFRLGVYETSVVASGDIPVEAPEHSGGL
ncbi:hypothetical protein QBC36DRAFT_340176 [Triangularia setosa]|uniref:Zn(2)-C6 fungal-type domain-containing protein n=1 Tax=Triangularia setosa TaxID=2587417 RepID=A0AAN6W078_9PEZI|nr:hypothetical protein QBC36DRAFT_340176 [Podospora setosa]